MARIQERILSDFYVNKVVNGVPYLARTRDLSMSGVYVHRLIEPRLPLNAAIALEFVLPGSDEVHWADVDLVRTDDTRGFGLRFRDLTPRVARTLAAFLSP